MYYSSDFNSGFFYIKYCLLETNEERNKSQVPLLLHINYIIPMRLLQGLLWEKDKPSTHRTDVQAHGA